MTLHFGGLPGNEMAKRGLEGFVLDPGGFESEQEKDELDAEPDAEGGKDGPEADGASENPAHEDGGTFYDGPTDPHRKAGLSFKHNHEAVPRSRSETRVDVKIGSQGDDQKTCRHHGDPLDPPVHGRDDAQKERGVHNQADDEHVQDGPEPQFFSRQGDDDAYDQPDGNTGRTDGNAEHICRSLVEDVPGCEAQIGLHGHDDAKTIKDEAEQEFRETQPEISQNMDPAFGSKSIK